jgi:hypothetical protein
MFIPGYRCKNKKLYSQCIMEVKDDFGEEEAKKNEFLLEKITPHTSINVLEEIIGFHTLIVDIEVNKHILFIMVAPIISSTLRWLTNYNVNDSH